MPRYVLYGESAVGDHNWSVNIEPVSQRCKERGWRIEPHSHPNFGQIAFLRSGRGTMTVEDQTVAFQSPCAIVVPIHCVHGYAYERDTDGWMITVAEHYMRQINERLPEFDQLWARPGVLPLDRDADETTAMRATIIKLEQEIESKAVGHVVAAEMLLTTLFLQLLRCANSSLDENRDLSPQQSRLVESFRSLLEKYYRQGWRIRDYCAAMGISEAQLRQACDSVCGETPTKMIQARRLTEAKRNLLFSDMTVEQIAYWLGFSSPAYFTRFFKNETGLPPANFRRSMKN